MNENQQESESSIWSESEMRPSGMSGKQREWLHVPNDWPLGI